MVDSDNESDYMLGRANKDNNIYIYIETIAVTRFDYMLDFTWTKDIKMTCFFKI